MIGIWRSVRSLWCEMKVMCIKSLYCLSLQPLPLWLSFCLDTKRNKKIKQEKTFCPQGHTPGPVFLQAFARFYTYSIEKLCLYKLYLFCHFRQQISFGKNEAKQCRAVRLQGLALLLLKGWHSGCEQQGSSNPAQVLLHLRAKAPCGKEAYLLT